MEMCPIEIANRKGIEDFERSYWPSELSWQIWNQPQFKAEHSITLQSAKALSEDDFESCFKLIEFTSSEDYRHSKEGWKVRSKRKEMKLLDLKYLLIKDSGSKIEGFVSVMPTYEDDYPVIYIYEIHLSSALQGTGLGTQLMKLVETIGANIPSFYTKLGYSVDEFSPPPKILRNGTKVEAEYVIMSKPIQTSPDPAKP